MEISFDCKIGRRRRLSSCPSVRNQAPQYNAFKLLIAELIRKSFLLPLRRAKLVLNKYWQISSIYCKSLRINIKAFLND